MADYNRSKSYSYSDDRMQIDNYHGGYAYGPRSSRSYSYAVDDHKMQKESYHGDGPYGPKAISTYPNDFRSNSISYAAPPPPPAGQVKDWNLKKGKSTNGTTSKSWSLNDPEFQRKKRVASYKVYSVEGKVKGSFRRSFRWLKDKYTRVVYGWW